MKLYKKVVNCGPVPHPDQSGQYLHDGETVSGDEWEPLVALGYVVEVDSTSDPVELAPEVAVKPVAAPAVKKAAPVVSVSDMAMKAAMEVPGEAGTVMDSVMLAATTPAVVVEEVKEEVKDKKSDKRHNKTKTSDSE